MALFLLTPTNLNAREWKLSSWKSPIYVEARDAIQARLLAEKHLALNRDPTRDPMFHPWWHPGLSRLEEVQDLSEAAPLLTHHQAPARPWLRLMSRMVHRKPPTGLTVQAEVVE